MRMQHRVVIVFAERYGASLDVVAAQSHVWLVASPENSLAAEEFWLRRPGGLGELTSGVTTFQRTKESDEFALDAVLELVEDHHGEFSAESPVQELLIVGLDSDTECEETLKQWGYDVVEIRDCGLVARRR